MDFLVLFGTGVAASVVWFIPLSATCMVYSSELGWPPLLVGLIAAVAQSVGYSALYFGGGRLVQRWAALQRHVDAARERWRDRLRDSYLPLTLVGGLTGAPPMVAVAALASAFDAPFMPFLALTFFSRLVRFTLFAGAGHAIMVWLAR